MNPEAAEIITQYPHAGYGAGVPASINVSCIAADFLAFDFAVGGFAEGFAVDGREVAAFEAVRVPTCSAAPRRGITTCRCRRAAHPEEKRRWVLELRSRCIEWVRYPKSVRMVLFAQ